MCAESSQLDGLHARDAAASRELCSQQVAHLALVEASFRKEGVQPFVAWACIELDADG
ncbi:MAG TPA: hypothetical protein VJR89_17570 [Polyangiales bacterium]|nr:hypothetical protein [Polyangiales bacterium]